ncbi:MAG TPA: TAT-variant-translocated molybdopterin oxidoreductase [Vicinamibacterales bacterium]|nr:TAT-variant-translocated molybdopterin oxidoreductase [Vicinamibacterales bacterium]
MSEDPPAYPASQHRPNRKGRDGWWRTVEERAEDPAFQEHLYNEFPSEIEAITDPVARRTFLKLMGASMALAGLTACTRQPPEKIVPYVRQPEELIPGKPLFFATAMTLGGVATGLLVESHEGRPTKIEGNALHPGSLGAADVFAQAAILGLYDPDRSQTLTNLGEIRPWSAFLGAIRAALAAQQPLNGAGVRLLTESINSPTLAAQIREVLARYPSAKWHQWDPASRENARAGAKLAFGKYVDAQYRVDVADVILSLDADFLGCGAGSLRYARDFARRRRPEQADRMNRLYALESMPTSTGARADHRLPMKPSAIERLAREIASAIGSSGSGESRGSGGSNAAQGVNPATQKWIDAVAKDLLAHRGHSLVIAGDGQPAQVHALAHAMNQALGNAGQTVVYTTPVEAEPVNQLDSLRDLVADMNAGKVDLLLIVSGNPVYTAPADLNFAEALGKVQLRAHLSLYEDETSALCHWQVPETHFLEAWSDARGYDGTVSIVQPLIAPLYSGRSAHELLAAMGDRPERSVYEIVREHWNLPGAFSDFDAVWRRWLHDGLMPGTAFRPESVSVARGSDSASPTPTESGSSIRNPQSAIEISFRNDPCVIDGRFANNGWLQELPKPITKLTWDNAVVVSPATAERLKSAESPSFQGGEHGQIISDVVRLTYQGRSVQGTLFAVVGHPDDCVTVHLGYGRTRAGRVGSGAGFNANAIRSSSSLSFGTGAEITLTGERAPLACTQYHHLMEGRGMVRAVTRDEYVRDPKSVHEGDETPPKTLTLYPDYKYDGYKWGMAIDINACIGCNACVVGCQAENNIPVIGKDQVLRGREMHWLRVDTYYRGPAEHPETFFQPVPCMQCENAPCEVVCPVGATTHSHEGLNDMVYNRCVGTRYCSDNCPYKVRRFNFLLYQDWNTPSLKLGRNPDVTVRSRGVMEKCTYCVQRINAAKIDAEKEDRPVRDGEIVTACQQACPADAIVFGNLNDPSSRVTKLKAEERNYSLLGELNTRPRTTYLAAVRNVNPELEA